MSADTLTSVTYQRTTSTDAGVSVESVSRSVLPLNASTVDLLRHRILQLDSVLAANHPRNVTFTLLARVELQETLNELDPGMQS